jgi:hypothetical protein
MMLGGSLASLESDLGEAGIGAPVRTGARTPVSAPPSMEPLPSEPVKETHVSGRFRAVERQRPVPPVPPPLPPTRKKVRE